MYLHTKKEVNRQREKVETTDTLMTDGKQKKEYLMGKLIMGERKENIRQ